jgi:S1-C subfamily serine protease
VKTVRGSRFTGKSQGGLQSRRMLRTAALALACAALGGAAALGIGRAGGLVGDGSARTVVVHEPAAASAPVPAAPVAGAFSPARIYARRSAGVVTVFSYFGGTAAQGSGFVVGRDGTILTNAHVISNAGETTGAVHAASSVYVEFADHDRVRARIVGFDVFDDVGVLKVAPSAHALEALPLGRSAAVVVGEPVVAIGSPLGNTDSLAAGIVSAVGRSIAALTTPRFQLIDAIQTDAPLAHGSSGGPLLDAAGRAIGINAQIRSDQGGSSGVGFAVPIDSAKRSLTELVAHGRVRYAYAGLQAEDLTPSLARRLQLPVEHGALVDEVALGGPAAPAVLRGGTHDVQFQGETVAAGGDVILAVAGRPVSGADSLVRIVTNMLRPGQRVGFRILRAGKERTLEVLLAARAPR